MLSFAVLADSYKYSHISMYPSDLRTLYSVLYVRNPKMSLEPLNGKIVVFGLRRAVRNLSRILEASRETRAEPLIPFYGKESLEYQKMRHFFDYVFENNLKLSDLLEIRHVPDGTILGHNEGIMTIQNKNGMFPWLTNFVETYLNSEIWKPSFVATQCAKYKAIETRFQGKYIRNSFAIHDFSARGMSGVADVQNSNQAHLMYFDGTDSVACVNELYEVYPKEAGTLTTVGTSIPATEHSVMCAYGKEHEIEAYRRLAGSPDFQSSPLAIVSDTWDLFGIIERLHNDPEFMRILEARRFPIVLRPDSGDPFKILCGDDEHPDPLYQKGVLRLVREYFGFDKVRVVYGDAITPELCERIYAKMKDYGMNPLDCLCLGIGSYSYQYATRDSVGFVTKATHATFADGREMDLVKSPKTGKSKASITGKIALKNENIENRTLNELRSYAEQQLLECLGMNN